MPFFKLDHGQVHYEVAGSGPLLMILPGNMSGAAHHAGELAYFSDRFQAVTFDYLGYGRSTRLDAFPEDFYWRNARHAVQLCRHLGRSRMFLLGTSGGGIAALAAAIAHPLAVRAVIADSAPAEYPPERVEGLLADREQCTPVQVAFWESAHGEEWRQVVAADSEMIHRISTRHNGNLYADRLSEISCPVLLTASYHDRWIGEPGVPLTRLLGQITTSKGVLFHAGGHPSLWTQAEAFRREADRFLYDVMTQGSGG